MFFERVYDRGLAQASYVVGCQGSGTALVIDPKRDIQVYRDIAEREGLTITKVTETHIHADFLSGARELATATGAELLLSDEGGPDWQYQVTHTSVYDGDVIEVGKLRLQAIHTPGHTPEHISFLLFDPPSGPEPRMLFTGDFVFVGDVGRPDLLEEAAGVVGSREIGARQMFASLQKLRQLPDHVLVWPGHGAGSACGKSLGAVPVSTLGFERATSWAFSTTTEAQFMEELLAGQPEPPRYFAMMKTLNRARPESSVLLQPPPVAPVALGHAVSRAAESQAQIVDLRDSDLAFRSPVSGAVNIPFDEGMATWFGWLLDYQRDIYLVGAEEHREEVLRALMSIGLDRVVGWIDAEEAENSPVGTVPAVMSVDAPEAEQVIAEGATVVDVRGKAEFQEESIPGARNVFLGYLEEHQEDIPRDKPVLVHCQGGYRSAIACSILRNAGYSAVYNLAGGFEAWKSHQRGSVSVG